MSEGKCDGLGGKIKPGKTAKETAFREEEECGLKTVELEPWKLWDPSCGKQGFSCVVCFERRAVRLIGTGLRAGIILVRPILGCLHYKPAI